MIGGNESINNVLNKRDLNSSIQEFISEARHEFYELNPILIIAAGGIIAFLIIFYIVARCKCPKGRSTVIFVTALIIFDFCLDVAFLIKSVGEVPYLYLPSLLILLIAAGFNMLFAFIIMLQQTLSKKNEEFKGWLHRHSTMAATFTLLSVLHVEILKMLSSNLLYLDCFNAPFNSLARKWLFAAGLFNVFIKDIPQFIILILYFKGVGPDFTFIALLTLIISFIILLSSAINRIYDLISFPSENTFARYYP
ncbi:hypothetical protein RhiirA5_406343 [Rhizophagus irregularis]|uniref:Uncharacterized protein n=1 Tax=Rhizophagus irregularis TaxID=588596 RepID=A0A2I1EE31_9GLOM|nr:hypothetical protein RhiirA5_406343 [Rhizophagus irregularis]PKY20369.1 hypothetical protein RhiirB3_433651 [Rhizophagus irregularis]CAB5352841.1 unnamed protein product [Rhizophagus irregularis]